MSQTPIHGTRNRGCRDLIDSRADGPLLFSNWFQLARGDSPFYSGARDGGGVPAAAYGLLQLLSVLAGGMEADFSSFRRVAASANVSRRAVTH